MGTTLIRLADDTLVEVEIGPGGAQQISGGVAERVGGSLAQIQPIITKVCRSIAETWQGLEDQFQIESTEVELGLSFEGEGNVFVSRAKAGANLVVTFTIGRRNKTAP